MPSLDIFSGDAFGVRSLTTAINDTPYQPRLIGSMGLFKEDGITTTTLMIERKGNTLTLVPNVPRGSPPLNIRNDKAKMIPIATTHLPERGAVYADEVQNVRAFGAETDLMMVQDVVNGKLAKGRNNLDATIEFQRIGAIKGAVLDFDGSTILDVFGTFGLSQQVFDMNLDSDTTKVKSNIVTATGLVESALGGVLYTGLVALCGPAFFAALVGHPAVAAAYDRWLDGAFLRTTQRSQNGMGAGGLGFEHVGVQWREYKGSVGGQSFIGTNDAYLVPLGVADMFLTYYAPADYVETVNTKGLPYYAKQELMKFGKGVEIEMQSNPISFNTRPDAVVKLTLT